MPSPTGRRPRSEHGTVDALTRVLVRACRALGEAGHPQEAARLAATAWSALRVAYADQAEHINGAMHHLARLEQALHPAAEISDPKGKPDDH